MVVCVCGGVEGGVVISHSERKKRGQGRKFALRKASS